MGRNRLTWAVKCPLRPFRWGQASQMNVIKTASKAVVCRAPGRGDSYLPCSRGGAVISRRGLRGAMGEGPPRPVEDNCPGAAS